jgi:tetratricopeptide (TPR) repeat protein
MLETLEITRDNFTLFEFFSQYTDRLIEFHLQRKDYDNALKVASIHEKHSIVASIYEKNGDYNEAGKYFLRNKIYDKALEYFQKEKNLPSIAKTYEKMKEYKKALTIWEELGKPRDIARMKKKLIKENVPVGKTDFTQKELF